MTAPRAKFLVCSIADQALVSGSNIALNIILARWLSSSEFGAFAILFSTFTLVGGFHNALLVEPLTVFGGGTFRHCLERYQTHVLWMHAGIAALSIPLIAILSRLLTPTGYSPLSFGTTLFGGMVAILLYNLLRRMAYVRRQYGAALIAGGSSIAISVGCLYLIRTSGGLSWITAFTAQSVAGLAASLLLYWQGRRSTSVSASREISLPAALLAHRDYGCWAVATVLVFWLSAEAYCVLAGRILGPAEAAGFRAMQSLSMLLPNFFAALSVLVLPRAAARYGDSGPDALGELVLGFVGAATAAAVVFSAALLAAGRPAVTFLYGYGYARFAAILPFLACNLVLIAASQGIQMGVRAMNAPLEIFYAFLAAAVTTCTVGAALTRGYGFQGAGAGLCLSTLSFLTVLVLRYRKLVRRSFLQPSEH